MSSSFGSQKRALIVVDPQFDFCEGGSLAVPGGFKTCDKIAEYIESNKDRYDLLVVSQDWHKPDDTNGGHIVLGDDVPDLKDSWPSHCLAESESSAIVPVISQAIDGWIEDGKDYVNVKKGYGTPSYSAFDGNVILDWVRSASSLHKTVSPSPTLRSVTQAMHVGEVHIMGLAYDYCVKDTAIAAANIQSSHQITEVRPRYYAAIDWLSAIEATRKMAAAHVEIIL